MVTNASTDLIVAGECELDAGAGYIGVDDGSSTLVVNGLLNPLELWNQPPTEPLFEPSQLAQIVSASVDGGWGAEIGNWGNSKWLPVNFPSYLEYRRFAVPRFGAALFEVDLAIFYEDIYNGSVQVDFGDQYSQDHQVLCPYVAVEILTPLETATP